MPDRDEKTRRKEIQRLLRENSGRSIRESLPVSAPMMKALFDHVDGELATSECDDTLRHTRQFINLNSLPEAAVVAWLQNAGGHCDCEVINNAEEALEDAIPGYSDLPSPEGIRK